MKKKKKFVFLVLMGTLFFLSILPVEAGEIHLLAKKGDIKKIKSLLEQNPELVNSKDRYQWTPLQVASLQGRLKVVRLLIEKGARVNETDRFGFTALHLAAIKGDNAVFELLAENGAVLKPKNTDESVETFPGMFSAADVPQELAELLFDDISSKELKNLREKKKKSRNPFIFTEMSFQQELIEVNLSRAKTGKKGKPGRLSLDYKTLRRLKELAESFIAKRTDARTKSNIGNTALHLAAQLGELDKVKTLVKQNPAMVKATNHFGITPLHYAAIAGYREIAALLAAAGADINAATIGGITPLYGAVSEGKKEMVQWLIAKGAKVNAETGDGASPLHSVTRGDIAELLVDAGAGVNSRNKYGFTPLHIAAHYGYLDVVESLLSRGARLESRTNYGWTPLCEAVYGKNKAVVELLISKGANVNAFTRSGSTPLEIALNFRQEEIAGILKKHGAH